MIEITPEKIKNSTVTVPGSKSYTHRFLIAAALADGISTIYNGLKSEDTLHTLAALRMMGIKIDIDHDRFVVQGGKGSFKRCHDPVYVGNSGTSMRLLTALASIGQGRYTFTGTDRMGERPIQDLLDGLRQIGIKANSVNSNGCPPVEIEGGEINGGAIDLKCGISSQFLSALLLIAPCSLKGIEINVVEGPVSRPYIDMTLQVMKALGIKVGRNDYDFFKVDGGQTYQAGSYAVEPDCSQAGYFWAAAAISGAEVKVKGITKRSYQGDIRFTEVLETMGCGIFVEKDGITVAGKPLSATTVDMADMPDMVPTLAVVAAFAKGTTVIKNVAHLKAKESDRLGSVVKELAKIGIEASCSDTGMVIKGGKPRGAEIDTYGDHRMAMSFALAGLKTPGVKIKDERCVEKSFPDFWHVFEGLYHR